MAATGNSCFLLVDSKTAFPLKPLGQIIKLTDDGRQVMAKAHIAFGKVS
jgi:hypothetical protein